MEHLKIWENGAYHCIKYSDAPDHQGRIHQLAGLNTKSAGIPAVTQPLLVNRPREPKALPLLPKLHHLEPWEARGICRTRGWSFDVMPALFELSDRGLLSGGCVSDDGKRHDAWVIKDSTRRSAQARRFYGRKWICGKAKSLYGSWGGWTIGAREIGNRPIVMLCEGMPDFVAALGVAYCENLPLDEVAPACIPGTAHRIHPEALPHFAKKRVRIFAHPDEGGQKAARVWAAQLFSVGASVSLATLAGLSRKDGVPVKDLADYLTLLDNESEPACYVLRDLWKEEITSQIDRWNL